MPGRDEPNESTGQQASQNGAGGGESARPADSGLSEEQAANHQPEVNQHKHEPHPASHDAASDDAASDESGLGAREGHEEPAARHARPGGPGQAVRDLMGGPQPQGDVPDAPATQIADAENEDDQVGRIRYVANAVPGKPDGEVDTRS